MKVTKPLKSILKVIASEKFISQVDKNGDGKIQLAELLKTQPKFWLFVFLEILFNTFGWNDYFNLIRWLIQLF